MQFELAWTEHEIGTEEVIVERFGDQSSRFLICFGNESVRFNRFSPEQSPLLLFLKPFQCDVSFSFFKNIYHLFSVNIKTKHIALTVPQESFFVFLKRLLLLLKQCSTVSCPQSSALCRTSGAGLHIDPVWKVIFLDFTLAAVQCGLFFLI